MSVEILYKNDAERLAYLRQHQITEVSGLRLFGCYIAKTELRNPQSKDAKSIIVLEGFDGKLQGITIDQLIMAEMDYRSNSEYILRDFEIFNMMIGSNYQYTYKKNYNRANYIPTIESITHYIWNYWKGYEDIVYGNLNIKATNLSKDQFINITSKLRMTGLQSGLVDYNTFAIAQPMSNGIATINVYSMQKKILTDKI
jgi:hypothetical protein